VRRTLFATAVLIATLASASAETWPTRPIRAIIPFGPGSAVDVVPRIVFEQMSRQLGQPIVVENRAGAGGTLGSAAVAKADAIMVPFKGGAEGITKVMAGRVDFYFCPIATALPHVKDGRLLGLAVSSPQRAAALPEIPTTLESGYPDSDYTFWMGIFMPAKTPPEIVAKFHDEMKKALDAPAVKEKLATLGVEPMSVTPAQFDAQVKKEIGTYSMFAKAAGMSVN
jgi:tripartite-type tricarboxylate transporter receptor subunit TctC